MSSILVVGAETVVGANIATRFATGHHVSTARATATAAFPSDTSPDWIVFAATAGEWGDEVSGPTSSSSAAEWARIARQAGIDFCLISSDAVFDGPRLFHTEVGGIGESKTARAAKTVEDAVRTVCPTALIARTSAFGWSPTRDGWIESQISGHASHDTSLHGTPLHAADLADMLLAARSNDLRGVWHFGGGERINPREFTRRLAASLEQPWAAPAKNGAGARDCSERSLCSSRLAAALELSLPMIEDGLARLADERESGFADQLASRTLEPLVA